MISRLQDPVGRSCLIEGITEKCITVVDCKILRANESVGNKRCLINYLNSEVYFSKVYNNVTVATRKRVIRKNLENIPIRIYDMYKQIIIANELDNISSVIKNNEAIIERLKTLIQSIFYEKFGSLIENPNNYKKKKLKDICLSIIRGPFGSLLKKDFFLEKGKDTFKAYEQKNAIQSNEKIGEYYIDEKIYRIRAI